MNDAINEKQRSTVIHRVQIEIGWRSILRVSFGILFAYLAILLWPVFKMLILAILIAVALHPVVTWVGRRGGPPWLGVSLAALMLMALIVGCFAVVGPIVLQQVSTLGETLPKLRDAIIEHLPATGAVRHALEEGMSSGTVADSRLLLQKLFVLAELTLGGLVSLVVVAALAIYLLIEGRRSFDWMIVFFPVQQRVKISQTLNEVCRLVSSYVAGQFLVSAFCAAYMFLLLKMLGVPMALMLGVVAGICDILPIIGFFIAVFLAMAMGLSVSPMTALLIFALYGAYHMFENFYIVPRVYGRKLKLSKLAVPLAVATGGMVAGVVGAIAVLPLVAAYPVIERLWLAPKLEPDTVREHEASSG